MRTFLYTDEKSNKFWHIELQGANFTVTFGRVGTNGKTQTKTFINEGTAKQEHDKLVAEKLRKGYVETTTAATTPTVSLERRSLEATLLEKPDDLATQSAYADYLMEQSDPRGEFIQTQLALEDSTKSKIERDALRKREGALLKKHARDWLGDAGRFLVGPWSGADKPYQFRFARGWLDFVRTLPAPEEVVVTLARSPASRLLRHLEVLYDMRYHPFEFGQFSEGPVEQLRAGERRGEVYDGTTTLPFLIESSYLTNLRVLKFGFSDDGDRPSYSTMVDPFGGSTTQHFIDLLKKCPRLEELHINTDLSDIDALFASPLLGNLRTLQYYYGSPYRYDRQNRTAPYPLSTLAQNSSLKHLTTLRFHPGRDTEIDINELDSLLQSKYLPSLAHLQVQMISAGDEAASRIVRSGILKRLKTLDLGFGNMTDDGAHILATSPDLKNLEMLNVSRNALTQTGISALGATGIPLVIDNQHAIGEENSLYEVDQE